MIVNNTGVDISMFISEFVEALKTGKLAEELSDIFSIDKIQVDGKDRLIVNFI